MFQPALESRSMPLLRQVAKFAERRHEAFSSNIANIDTPGYKSRDLPTDAFQQALSQAIKQQSQPQSPSSPFTPELGLMQFPSSPFPLQPSASSTSSPSLDDLFTPDLFQAQPASSANLTFQDGANHSIEQMVTEMTKNLMLQSYALQLMNAQFGTLQAVISERP